MNLATLVKKLKGLEFRVYGKVSDVEVRHVTSDSRLVGVRDIFIAKRGAHFDGNDFIKQALDNGAIAIVSDIYNPFFQDVLQIIAQDVALMEAALSSKCYGSPADQLRMVGVTGTNGKTTVASLIRGLLEKNGIRSGLLGTIGYFVGDQRVSGDLTTPTAASLHRFLYEMVKGGMDSAVMEVSSIGLKTKRVEGVSFDIAVFTNLTLDHLDFHGTLEEYARIKGELFKSLSKDALAVLNADSPYSQEYSHGIDARIVSYGVQEDACFKALDISLFKEGSSFDVIYQGQKVCCESPLVGLHNVYNILAALAVAVEGYGIPLDKAVKGIRMIQAPIGRLDRVEGGACPVFIDYAHTPDALENVLNALQGLLSEGGQMITVFGCGGDRDRSKRPIMAQIAEKYGFTIVTTDNPRSEDPMKIIEEICLGFRGKNFSIEIDRKQAIKYALSIASDKDLVLIAGKGHETYQIFKHRTVFFDDKEEVLQVLSGA